MIWGDAGQALVAATINTAAPAPSTNLPSPVPGIFFGQMLMPGAAAGGTGLLPRPAALALLLLLLWAWPAHAAGPAVTTLLSPNPASGSVTADGNNNVLAGGSASGTYLAQLDLRNMAAGDVVEYRSWKRAYGSDGTVTSENFGSGTGSATQFLHALGGGATGMTLNQSGVTSGTTGSVTIATPPASIPIVGQFYVLNAARLEWAVAQYVSATSINLITRGALGTTAAAWTTADALTIANQAAQPGTVIVTAPSSVVSTDTPGFGNPNTSGAPNGLSGVCGGSGIASGIIDYANGAVSITFSSAPASGSNNITVAYTPLYLADYLSFNNAQSTPLPPLPAKPTEGAVMFAVKQVPNAINGSITGRAVPFGILNLNGT